jgi:crossover junction endodeoxyribonuclease RuvC
MKLVAIDPGSISGAYAVLETTTGAAIVGDLPTVDKNINSSELSRLLRKYDPHTVVLERVGAMPKNGPVSMFSFGRGVGRIEGVIGSCGICLEYVTPVVWKKYYRLPGTAKNKELSRVRALQLYPKLEGLSLKKHSGRAEALLIAHWFAEVRL